MRIRFWGTRGSLAKPGPATVRYGGNTSCVEVTARDGTLIVLDCGTGAHELGQHLAASREPPICGHLLITHTHWDHIQGFPFFTPLFVPGNEWDVYAPQGVGQRLEDTLAGQMEYSYFPVGLRQLGATIRYHELVEGAFDVGEVRVTARYMNHPGLAMGYRLEAGGVALVYATDHEPHSPHQPDAPGRAGAPAPPVHREDREHIEFLAGADLVIHDAQYELLEYPTKRTWGHSPAELAVDWALAGGVKRLALFHHDPLRSDEAVDRIVESCRRRAAASGRALDVFGAAEGQVIELARPAVPTPRDAPAENTAPRGRLDHAPPSATVLIVDEAVYALQDLQPGLEKVYFTLQEELLKPQAQIKLSPGDTIDNLVLQPVLPAPRQQVAEVLLTAVKLPAPKRFVVDPVLERKQRVQGQVQQIGGAMFNYVWNQKKDVIVLDKATGRWAFRADVLTELVKANQLPPQALESIPGVKLTLHDLAELEKEFTPDAMGKAVTAQRIQELFLAKRKDEATAAVPDEFCDEMSLVGPVARIRERYRAWAECGITGLTLVTEQPEAMELMASLAHTGPSHAPGYGVAAERH